MVNDHLIQALSAFGHTVTRYSKDDSPTIATDVTFWDTLYLSSLLEQRTDHVSGFQVLLLHSDSAQLRSGLHDLQKRGLGFISMGRFLHDQLIDQGISKENCLLLEPGGQQPNIKRSFGKGAPVKLAMVANLTLDKGLLAFFQNWPIDQTPAPAALHVHLYGDPQIDPEHAQSILSWLQRPEWGGRVSFHGIVPQDQLFSESAGCHALLSVSPSETFGMAIRDARAAGLPVLALKGGNIPYLIEEGVDGKLYAQRESLISDLIRLTREPEKFADWLGAFTPRPLVIPSWEQQGRKLMNWLSRHLDKG